MTLAEADTSTQGRSQMFLTLKSTERDSTIDRESINYIMEPVGHLSFNMEGLT